jgi:hypothetical protein
MMMVVSEEVGAEDLKAIVAGMDGRDVVVNESYLKWNVMLNVGGWFEWGVHKKWM